MNTTDTVQISRAAREASEQACPRKPLIRRPSMGFIGWTVACLRDWIERGEQAVYCDDCDTEIAPETTRCDDGLIRCDECRISNDRAELERGREDMQANREGWAAYQRR